MIRDPSLMDAFQEPRKGRRIEPGAIIKHPNSTVGNLLVYSVHLEVFV